MKTDSRTARAGQFVRIDSELTIYYEEAGSGPLTLLLVTGWTMSCKVFERQLDFFTDSTDCRCIAFDPRAHGRSSKTEGGHYYEQHGRDLNRFIEQLSLDNIVLCGWSFGCLEILSYVNQFGTDRLAGLVMLDGPPRAAGENKLTQWVSYRYDDRDGFQEFCTMGRLRDKENTNIEFAKWMLEDQSRENIDWVLEITNQTPDTVAALLNATAIFLDYQDDLISLGKLLPLWFAMREQAQQVVSAWAATNTPAAKITGFGEHLMFWERPEQFNQELVEFLNTCRNGPGCKSGGA